MKTMENYSIAYAEVLEVLKYISLEDYNKIPQKYITFLEENADENCLFEYNVALPFDKQNISGDAKNVLGMIFRLYIIGDNKNTEEKIKILHTMGVETIYCPDEKNQIDLKKLMADLGNRGIDSILLEGGGTLNDSALRAGIVKEVQAFVAPKLFGGVAGKTPVEGIGVELPSEAVELKYTDICQIGEDIRIKCQVCDKKQEESCLQES